MDPSASTRRALERARSLAMGPLPASAALVILLAWQLASLTWSALPAAAPAVPPAEPANESRQADIPEQDTPPALALARMHLFGRPPAPKPAAAAASAPETDLDLALKGIYAPRRGAGVAVISVGGGGEQVFAVGDTIAGSARITAIFPDRVLLRRGGQAEVLRMPGDDRAAAGQAETGKGPPRDA